ncbi:MAG TPA: HAD hydrolase-like protein [Bryobacteraceae bacterium]|nr:HAD hydrolase-like protein [Bryobacteraceae bacterium]
MTVFLDIGSTLIDGPPAGPGQRIAAELELGADAVPAMNDILFKTDASESAELAERVSKRFGIDLCRSTRAIAQIWDAQFAESYVLPGAVEAIESLRAAGIERVYVSNIWRPFYLRFETAFSLEAKMQPCFPSFRTRKMKPDPELLCEICREVGTNPQEAIMVGDTWEADMAPAMEIGMATIWILHRPTKEKRDLLRILNGKSARPDLTLECIGGLSAEIVRQTQEIHARR